jgi:LemA protein
MRYKNRIEMFPSNVIAGMFNFHPEPFFQLEEPGERAVPQVKF